ncbi:graves disease carrier protein isoform X1 [Tetranychus urticae]|uniref:Mitochondrial carrier protein n=2 Tax=Tetranychus urticae TaxID=32264 RepID=T1JV79_TETUR|nr:graves disease carrier protein isoform X1 [Tetranychus urticae]
MSLATSPKNDINFFAKTLLAGGVAGMTSKTAVAPLDRIKILLQAHNTHYKDHGVFSGLRGIVEKERLLGLYRGNGAQMVRIFPYAAVQFLSFEIYKKHLSQMFGVGHSIKFFAGSMAGVTAVMTTYPLDLVRARLAFTVTLSTPDTGIKGAAQATGIERFRIIATMNEVLRHEGGFRALYKGLSPTILAMVPHAGLSFYSFERLKHFALQYFPEFSSNQQKDRLVLNFPAKLICGGISGAIAQPFSYPLDVARRRMQLSMLNPETYKYSKNLITTLMITYREHGIYSGLYRGMSINYIRAVPMVAVSFTAYEVMKQLLGLDTSVDG